jgi:hypothetical protein
MRKAQSALLTSKPQADKKKRILNFIYKAKKNEKIINSYELLISSK